jgi:hypothetical protein
MAAIKRFRAMLETEEGSTFTFIVIPFDVKQTFGRARPPVKVTINGYEYRSTLAPYGNRHYLGVNRSVREGAKLKAGDAVKVTLRLDEELRDVQAPADFARALKANPGAKARWDSLSFTHQREYVEAIEKAKKPETRARRIEKTIEQLLALKQL